MDIHYLSACSSGSGHVLPPTKICISMGNNEGAPADTLFTRTNGGVYMLQVVQVFVSKILPKRTALLLYNGHTYIPYQLRDHQLLDMCLPSYIKSSFTDSFWDSFSSHMTSCPGSWLEQQSRIQRSTFGKHC